MELSYGANNPRLMTTQKTKTNERSPLAGVTGSANLVVKKTKHGYEINCPKGLWGVSGPDVRSVMSEALHYYRQYAADGEYEDSPNVEVSHSETATGTVEAQRSSMKNEANKTGE